MTESIVSLEGLSHFFADQCVLDQVSLQVPAGSVFAFLGRNGSGKTTAIRILLGLLAPSQGRATVFGVDSQALTEVERGRIGYMAEGHPLPPWMRLADIRSYEQSCRANWHGALFDRVIDHFAIAAHKRVKTLSRGQRAGVALAITLASRPDLLILDDPALGLDPVARRALLEALVYVVQEQSCTIFFSTHDVDDVERVADHVAILDRSVLRCSGSLDYFRSQIKRWRFSGTVEVNRVAGLPGVLVLEQDRNQSGDYTATVVASDELRAACAAAGIQISAEHDVSFDDAVLAYLGQRGVRRSFFEGLEGVA